MSARLVAAGVAALAVGAGIPGAALAKTPAPARTPRPSAKTKTAALPATGDWEGTGAGGTTASFEVALAGGSTHAKKGSRKTSSQKTSATTYRVVEDFAVDAPIACTNSSAPAIPVDVEVVNGPLRVANNGTFSSGAIRNGAGTTLSGRLNGTHFTIAYRHVSSTPNQFAGGTEICDTGKISVTAAPGHRQTLKDGIWSGDTQTNEPVVFYVVAGGRAIQAPAHPPSNGSLQASFTFGQFTQTCGQGGCSPSSNDPCAYESATSLYVSADGAFSNANWYGGGDNPTVSGTFTASGQANGQFTNGPNACDGTDWSATAG